MKLHKLRDGGLRFTHLPRNGEQTIAQQTLLELADHVTISPGMIVFDTVDGDVAFEILFPPGRHCLTCGERLSDLKNSAEAEAAAAAECRAHVATHSDPFTSERWPHGYISMRNSYRCRVKPTKLTKSLMARG